jgi:hypothetical protein
LTSRGYEQVAQAHGVTVYSHPDRDLLTMAGEGMLAAPPDKVRGVLIDYEHHVDMLERLATSRVLDRGPGWLTVYQQLSLSIISNRDYTMLVRWGADGQTLWLRFRTANDRGPPENDDFVRMPVHRGCWQLKPVQRGRMTFARYQVELDLGGWLPRWMVGRNRDFEIPDLFDSIRKSLVRTSH